MGNSNTTLEKSSSTDNSNVATTKTHFHYGDQEAEDYLTEVIDNCVWRKAVTYDGKTYWATTDPNKLGEPVKGSYKFRHFGSYLLLAPTNEEDEELDAAAIAKRTQEANQARVDAFLEKVAANLWAHLNGETDVVDRREGGPSLLTPDRMQAILEKIVNSLVAFWAQQGTIVPAKAIRDNLNQQMIKSAMYLDFPGYISELITDGVLVKDVHGKLDQDFDNMGPEVFSEGQSIDGGLPMWKIREDEQLQHRVIGRDFKSRFAIRTVDEHPDDEAGYESEGSIISQDHCQESTHYPVCDDDCWLHNVRVTEEAQSPEPSHRAIAPVSTPAHAYEKLDAGFIRVLILHPGTAEDTIRCDLNAERIENTEQLGTSVCETSFEALSYTWGDSTPTDIITCNGVDFPVSENLFHALHHLRLIDKPRVLWIDAICINQNDVDERNEQIRYMYAIYQTASRVVVWLGIQYEGSDLAMQSANYLKSPDHRHDIVRHYHDLTCIQNLEKIVIALERLLERLWFRRSWIRQEISAATRITVYCGSSEVSWTALKRAANALWRLREKVFAHPFGDAYIPSIEKDATARTEDRLRFLKRKVFAGRPLMSQTGDLRSVWYYHAGGLLDHLMVSRAFEATDPRDKVYAVLGMVDVPISTESSDLNPEIPCMPIDYSASISEVYQQTAKYIINRYLSLDILCILSSHRSPLYSSDLPSWVPDWRVPTSDIPLYRHWDYFSYKFGAAGFTKCQPQDTADDGKLVVDGFCVTQIGELLPVGVLSIQHPPEEPTGYAQDFDPETDTRRMAMTDKGGAVIPSAAVTGDQVWILMGCKMPIVLRPVGDEGDTSSFCVIGPCYMATVMWGKGLKEFEESDRETSRIVLV